MRAYPLLIALSLFSILIICYFIIPSFHDFVKEAFKVLTSDDQQQISKWVSQFGVGGPFVLILIMVVQMFLFVVPNVLVMMAAILMYGPVWGALISFLGVFCSSSIGYFIGNYFGPKTVDKLMSRSAREKTSDFIHNYGVAAIAITRIASLSNDSLSIVAGLLKMKYRNYILATLVGIAPLIFILAIYGKNGKILKSLIWIGAISLVVLIVYIRVDKKRKKTLHKDHLKTNSRQ